MLPYLITIINFLVEQSELVIDNANRHGMTILAILVAHPKGNVFKDPLLKIDDHFNKPYAKSSICHNITSKMVTSYLNLFGPTLIGKFKCLFSYFLTLLSIYFIKTFMERHIFHTHSNPHGSEMSLDLKIKQLFSP
jgi:hypothetical protein